MHDSVLIAKQECLENCLPYRIFELINISTKKTHLMSYVINIPALISVKEDIITKFHQHYEARAQII